jgi:hypothetical protein
MLSTVTLPKTKKYHYARQWNLKDIWHLSKDLPVSKIPVSELWDTRYSKVFCWQLNAEEITNDFFLHHLERVLDADLSYPIILSEDNYILDGVHRLMKCKHLSIEHINYVKFQTDPKPNKVINATTT